MPLKFSNKNAQCFCLTKMLEKNDASITNKQGRFQRPVYITVTSSWQRHIRQLNYKKTKVSVVNLLAAIFGEQRIKGFTEMKR